MKRNALPVLLFALAAALISIVAVIAAQPTPTDPFDPPAAEPTPAPADWLTPGRIGRHLDVVPVSPNKVPVRQISIPRPQQADLLKPTADGGCLAIQTIAAPGGGDAIPSGGGNGTGGGTGSGGGTGTGGGTGSGGGTGTGGGTGSGGGMGDSAGTSAPLVQLRAIRYRADGSILWDRTDATDRIEGYPVSMCVWADGSFAVGLNEYASQSGAGHAAARLLRYAADGTRIWTADASLTPAGSLKHVFALGDGSLLTAGAVENMQANGAILNQIQLQRLGTDGRRLRHRQLTLPGSAATGSQMISGASFLEGNGLTLAWRSIPLAQTTFGEANGQAMVLTMLDADLDEQWSVRLADGINIHSVQTLPDRFGILALGSRQADSPSPIDRSSSAAGPAAAETVPPADASSGTGFVSALFHFDPQGVMDWQHSAGAEKTWLVAAGRLTDGQYVAGQFQVKDDGSETTSLLVFPANGQGRRELLEIPGRIEQLVPSGGGGFTAVLRQSVRALPQPPFISSLWTDTEAIVCQFNRRLQLAWRRTIDQYKHTTRSDLVVVTTGDRLLAG